MERSRKIILEISSASQKVIIAANKYADRKALPSVQRSHFQLEADMHRIHVACNTIASFMGGSPFSDNPLFDVRLQDWLSSDEPGVCLDTLRRMGRLLQDDTRSIASVTRLFFPRRRHTVHTQDAIKKVVDLYGSCKGCFHFLFTTEFLNNEEGMQQQQQVPPTRGHIPSESAVFDQMLLLAAHTSIENVAPKMASYQCGHAAAHETGSNMQNGKNAWNIVNILEWLDGLNCVEKQDVTLLLRQPDTCKWLLETTQYREWRDGQNPCLWLYGKPGAGKSVLISSVIDSLEQTRCEGEVLSFFYCDFRNERSTSSSEVLRSVLSQMLRRLRERSIDPGSLVDDLVEAKDKGGAIRDNTKELANFTCRAAMLFTPKPLVVVDALDECKDLERLLEGLNALKEHVRFLASSRPLLVIKDAFTGVPFISMDDMVKKLSADIALHVNRELGARRRLRFLRSEIRTEIRSVLCHKADGMFRWVQCSLDTLNRCVTLSEIQGVLDNLPEGLDETYKRILLAIDTKTREGRLVLRVLVWLVAALRPMRMDELMEGLSINLGKRTLDKNTGPMHKEVLLDMCGSLVTYIEKTDVVILSHFSVKEYLLSQILHAELPQYHIDWEHAHLQLSQWCMCYISVCLERFLECNSSSSAPAESDFDNGIAFGYQNPVADHLMRLNPLLDYVLKDALGHFQYIGPNIASILHDIEVLDEDIQRQSQVWDYILTVSCATYVTFPCWPMSYHDLALYILVAFAPNSLLSTYIPYSILGRRKGTNPLIYAALFNKCEHARTLLSRGAKLNCRGWDLDDFSQALPIEVAVRIAHDSIIAFFITEGSPLPPQIFRRSGVLSPICVLSHSSIKKPLLQTDHLAEILNDPSNDLELQFLYSSKRSVIHDSIHGNDLIAVVQRMSQVAPMRGHIEELQYFDTLLRKALEECREDVALGITKLIVRCGFDPLRVDSSGKTPLHIAVQRAYVSIARYLIHLGAQLPSDLLATALESQELERGVSKGAKVLVVRFLVESGVDVHFHTRAGNSMLHVALESCHESEALELTRLLVGCGCDPLEANRVGTSPLRVAIERAHITVVQYFLSLGISLPPDIFADLNPQGAWRMTPMIRLLVENGASVHACTKTGDSVFHVVLHRQEKDDMRVDEALDATKLLVGYGCAPLKANSSGITPLRIAIEQGHISVVRHLLSLGISLPSDLFVTLNPHGKWKKIEMIRLLVENGADVHTRNEVGDSILHVVLETFNPVHDDHGKQIVEFLIIHGCDPFETNSKGKTPIHLAIERQHHAAEHTLRLTAERFLPLIAIRARVDLDELLCVCPESWGYWGVDHAWL